MTDRIEKDGWVFDTKENGNIYYGYSPSPGVKQISGNCSDETISIFSISNRNFIKRLYPYDGNSAKKYGTFQYGGEKYFIKEYEHKRDREYNNGYNELVGSYLLEKNITKINKLVGDNGLMFDILRPIYGSVNIFSGKGLAIYQYIDDMLIGNKRNDTYMKSRNQIDQALYEITLFMLDYNIDDIRSTNTFIKESNKEIHVTLFDSSSYIKTPLLHNFLKNL